MLLRSRVSLEVVQSSVEDRRDDEAEPRALPRDGAAADVGRAAAGAAAADLVARRLREQVQGALSELLRGLQRAHEADEALLRGLLEARRRTIYAGLVTAVMRLVFLLYAEARGLLPALAGRGAATPRLALLFAELDAERLRQGADLELRYGAWARLLSLFRAVQAHAGASRGGLFDPDAYPFLEGRPPEGAATQPGAPRLSDGVVHRVLAALLVVDGAPVRYEDLEVERIGSLYEGLLGFDLEIAEGTSMALLPSHGVVDLEALLALPPGERAEQLAERADVQLGARLAAAVHAARTVDELAGALARRASPRLSGRLARGTLYLQPGLLRRRAGSYYTPRALTRLIVERALTPLLQQRGRPLDPEQILSLAVCDPAMGVGAFLVEACRALGEHLEAAWRRAGTTPRLASGEAVRLHARKLVAERCLHGVDLDPLAVELARVSLWLEARAEGRPLSFLDRNLRCGNSLLGATRAELAAFPDEASRRDDEASRASTPRPRPRARRDAVAPAAPGAAAPDAAAGPPPDAGGAASALLDAWLAIWFWPTEGEPAQLAPTAATFGGYLAAALDPGEPRAAVARKIAAERRFLHWELAFPSLFDDRREAGFDAVLGNPPWVAFVGRAAQPIEPSVFNAFLRRNPAFHGYRSLHGLFVHRAASLLRPGGRLGLVVPTSVSDLDGYQPTRRAHDAMCAVDPDLPSFGSHAFEGVFQPAMGLLSTRLASAVPRAGAGAPWPLTHSDLDPVSSRLLARLLALLPLPASLFGERGFQTTTEDAEHIRRTSVPVPPCTCPLREGADIGELIARAPRHHVARDAVKGRFRPDGEWKAVKLLIRQTARYPIAALGDGTPFRNSILAGFSDGAWSEFALLCYLNSWPVRWFHYVRHRDAREGMPQVKIAHLRAIPAPPRTDLLPALDALGREVGPANAGLSSEVRGRLEDLVAEMLGLSEEERACVARWAEENPLPRAEG
jgi:N-6 DNA Methylase